MSLLDELGGSLGQTQSLSRNPYPATAPFTAAEALNLSEGQLRAKVLDWLLSMATRAANEAQIADAEALNSADIARQKRLLAENLKRLAEEL